MKSAANSSRTRTATLSTGAVRRQGRRSEAQHACHGRAMPLQVSTAAHIDHGKTALGEAVTGKKTGRRPEEREGGSSIDVGYAPPEPPAGPRLSVVDVPGHERFV